MEYDDLVYRVYKPTGYKVTVRLFSITGISLLLHFILLFSILAVLVMLLARDAKAEENRGVSFILSMCSKNAKAQKKFYNQIYKNAKVLNAGWLYGATSNPDACTWAKSFYKDERPKRVRIHVCNSTCFPERGRYCQAKECFAGYKSAKDASKAILANDKGIFNRVDRIIEMIKSDYKAAPKNTVKDFAVSGCLECTLTRDARKRLAEYIKGRLAPLDAERKAAGLSAIAWVDNPLESVDSCMDGYLCEKHGTPKRGKKGIADNDGVDYDGINQVEYWTNNKDAYMVLAWKPCLNGAASVAGTSSAGGKFIPPQNRTAFCSIEKEGVEFSALTNSNLVISDPDQSKYKAKTTKGCKSFEPFDSKFVWKLADGSRNFTTWLAPSKYKKFSKVQLICDGKVVDSSYPQIGYRFGQEYSHDNPPRRKIYDFRKNIGEYPIEGYCVLHADNYCWKMQYPYFRPVKK